MKLQKGIQSILVILLGFLLLYLVFRWKGFLWIGSLIGIPGLVSSILRTYILRGWYKLASILGFINSKIILSVIFYLILTPIALVSRIFSKDKMQIKKRPEKDSYFTIRNHEFTSDDFKNPW